MRTKRFLSIILVLSLVVSLMSGCGSNEVVPIESQDDKQDTEVNVTVIDQGGEELAQNQEISAEAKEADYDLTAMVSSMVSAELVDRGYEVNECIAFSNDNSYEAYGLGYYDPEISLFANDNYASLGFLDVIGPNDDFEKIPETAEYIAVESVDDVLNTGAQYNLLAYSCDEIPAGHLVYKNQYVIYYQLDDNTIKYETFENVEDNYDYSIGSLYDFDDDTFIYNEALFGEYETHSGEELFSEEDYLALEAELQELSAQQEKNGYYVEDINIVYISPESIEAYLASQEEDTFFGYSVSELESSLGAGSALVYTENGIETAEYFEDNPEDYNWKSFLTKIGIGCGIILVGAVLTPITGGASFGCALITISKVAVTMALAQGLGTLAIETATSMIEGHDFEEAIKHASFKGLDSFANGFVIGSVVGSVGVVSGLIKPVACFSKGTPIAVPGDDGKIEFKSIEEIDVGEKVYAYNEDLKSVGVYDVTETFCHKVDELIILNLGNELIQTTFDHPFYSVSRGGWVPAGQLSKFDTIMTINGTVEVYDVRTVNCEDVDVYNFTVEEAHTYFVGEESVLVHNQCSKIKNARNKGVERAWKKEVQAVKDGNSKYNWTKKELKELMENGKVQGYQGCHIVDVQANPNLASNPDNIILLKREVHINVVHGGNTNNLSHWGEIIKVMPQFEQQILAIGGLL